MFLPAVTPARSPWSAFPDSICFCLAASRLPQNAFNGLTGFQFVIDEIEWHLFSITSKGRSFFVAQAVEFEHSLVTGLCISLDGSSANSRRSSSGNIRPSRNADSAQVLRLKAQKSAPHFR